MIPKRTTKGETEKLIVLSGVFIYITIALILLNASFYIGRDYFAQAHLYAGGFTSGAVWGTMLWIVKRALSSAIGWYLKPSAETLEEM